MLVQTPAPIDWNRAILLVAQGPAQAATPTAPAVRADRCYWVVRTAAPEPIQELQSLKRWCPSAGERCIINGYQ